MPTMMMMIDKWFVFQRTFPSSRTIIISSLLSWSATSFQVAVRVRPIKWPSVTATRRPRSGHRPPTRCIRAPETWHRPSRTGHRPPHRPDQAASTAARPVGRPTNRLRRRHRCSQRSDSPRNRSPAFARSYKTAEVSIGSLASCGHFRRAIICTRTKACWKPKRWSRSTRATLRNCIRF